MWKRWTSWNRGRWLINTGIQKELPVTSSRWSWNKRLQQVKRRSTVDRMHTAPPRHGSGQVLWSVSLNPPTPHPFLFALHHQQAPEVFRPHYTDLDHVPLQESNCAGLFLLQWAISAALASVFSQSGRGASSLDVDTRAFLLKRASITVMQLHVSAVIYSCVCKGLM